jgi:hypothetical protein
MKAAATADGVSETPKPETYRTFHTPEGYVPPVEHTELRALFCIICMIPLFLIVILPAWFIGWLVEKYTGYDGISRFANNLGVY